MIDQDLTLLTDEERKDTASALRALEDKRGTAHSPTASQIVIGKLTAALIAARAENKRKDEEIAKYRYGLMQISAITNSMHRDPASAANDMQQIARALLQSEKGGAE